MKQIVSEGIAEAVSRLPRLRERGEVASSYRTIVRANEGCGYCYKLHEGRGDEQRRRLKKGIAKLTSRSCDSTWTRHGFIETGTSKSEAIASMDCLLPAIFMRSRKAELIFEGSGKVRTFHALALPGRNGH